MNWLSKAMAALGAVVDTVVPVGVGSRTKIAVVACPLLSFVAPAIAAIPGAEPYLPLIPAVQKAMCYSAPALAFAGLVRK
jgi:hypothetical protein